MITELFPITDYSKLQHDTEGLYSITNFNDADNISNLILENFINNKILNILDGTGGLGGNTISFAKYFKSVTSIEINHVRYEMLKNNLDAYNLKNVNVNNCDSVEYLFNNYTKYNIYFFDPPWGGPSYKKKENLTLTMCNIPLLDIASFLKEHTNDKILVYKLPFNYNFNEFNGYDYKLYKINKYYIIVILI